MGALLSREVLYEPLALMAARFPSYLRSRGPGLAPAERARAERQAGLLRQLMTAFEGGAGAEGVAGLMSSLQQSGDLPPEVLEALTA